MTERTKSDLKYALAYLLATAIAGAFVCWRLGIWVLENTQFNK